jgi:hypothetical protein
MHAIYDTLVFLAISFRILSYTVVGDTFEARVKSFFRGTGLPNLSRSILQGGQLYYLFAVRATSGNMNKQKTRENLRNIYVMHEYVHT